MSVGAMAQSFTVVTKEGVSTGFNSEDVESIDFSAEQLPIKEAPIEFSTIVKSVVPTEGVVNVKSVTAGLGTIRLTLKGLYMANTKCTAPALLGTSSVVKRAIESGDAVVSRDFMGDETEVRFTIDRAGLTEPGNYYLSIPQGYLITTQGHEVSNLMLVYVIEENAPEQSFSASPEAGKVESIQHITIKYDNYSIVKRNDGIAAQLIMAGNTMPSATAVPEVGEDGSVSISFAQPVTMQGTYTLVLPEGLFTLQESADSKAYSSARAAVTYQIGALQQQAPRKGDYYYSDGTWSTTLRTDVEPIGIVFYVGIASEYGDNKVFYKTKNGESSISDFHGYVIALKDATYQNGEHVPCAWSFFNGNDKGCGCSSATDDFLGYTNTQAIRSRAAKELGGRPGGN